MPYGMVKLGPDLHTGSDSYSGYQPNGKVMGFSMTHETGTGGAPKYGVVAQMPALNAVDINWAGEGYEERSAPDETQVGYYKTTLNSGIVTELGATDKAGMFKYTFPEDQGRPTVIVDVSHVLPSFRGNGWGQSYKGGKIVSTADQGKLQYRGWAEYDNVSLFLNVLFLSIRCLLKGTETWLTDFNQGMEHCTDLEDLLLRLFRLCGRTLSCCGRIFSWKPQCIQRRDL